MRELLLALLLAAAAGEQPIRLSGPETITISNDLVGQVGEFIYVKATTSNQLAIQWQSLDPGLKMVPTTYLRTDDTGIFVASAPGKYRILVWQKDTREAPTFGVITVGLVPPNPSPVPPTPIPIPIPPTPIPTIVSKLRVVIFYESSDLRNYPRPQQLIFSAKNVANYLDSHCIKGPDGKTPDYRFYDKDVTDFSKEAKVWQDVAVRAKKSIPWLVILDGDTPVLETELPKSDTEFLSLLQKYGG